MALSANDPRPQHQQIADDLRAQIAAGEFAPGDRLPTIKDLMERYGVYNQAVQAALKTLQIAGLTEGVPGRGTFVRTDVDPTALRHSDNERDLYETLSQRLDDLAAEMERVHARLDEFEAGQRKKPSAKRS